MKLFTIKPIYFSIMILLISLHSYGKNEVKHDLLRFVAGVEQHKTIKDWVESSPDKVKLTNRLLFGKFYETKFPQIFPSGNSLLIFNPESKRLKTLKVIEAKEGRYNYFLDGRDVSFQKGETNKKWLERNFPEAFLKKYALSESLIDVLIPKAYAKKKNKTILSAGVGAAVGAGVAVLATDAFLKSGSKSKNLNNTEKPLTEQQKSKIRSALSDFSSSSGINFRCTPSGDIVSKGKSSNLTLSTRGFVIDVKAADGRRLGSIDKSKYLDRSLNLSKDDGHIKGSELRTRLGFTAYTWEEPKPKVKKRDILEPLQAFYGCYFRNKYASEYPALLKKCSPKGLSQGIFFDGDCLNYIEDQELTSYPRLSNKDLAKFFSKEENTIKKDALKLKFLLDYIRERHIRELYYGKGPHYKGMWLNPLARISGIRYSLEYKHMLEESYKVNGKCDREFAKFEQAHKTRSVDVESPELRAAKFRSSLGWDIKRLSKVSECCKFSECREFVDEKIELEKDHNRGISIE